MTERLPVVLAVLNNKGGVGKTTTAVNLAAALAAPRRRVLLIDLDSEASASRWCGVPRNRLSPSSAHCLLERYPIGQAIRSTGAPYLDLITGSFELVNADLSLAAVGGRETTLKGLLRPLRQRYHTIVLDCPPSLSLVGINALVAADALIVPVTPHFLSADGLSPLLTSIDRARTRLHARAKVLGILITMADDRDKQTEIRERLRAEHRDRVFHTEIARSRALQDAPAAGKSILAAAPRSPAADAFRRLAGEVLERLAVARR